MLIDRAGAIVERYCYDAYGRPFIRESCGRGDMDDDTDMDSTDDTRFAAALAGSIWDPRADLDDDGDVDGDDQDLYDAKYDDWPWFMGWIGVAQAFSDAGNPYMFQGVPHFALDTAAEAASGKLLLNHHRARFAEPVTGRWVARDPLHYNAAVLATQPQRNSVRHIPDVLSPSKVLRHIPTALRDDVTVLRISNLLGTRRPANVTISTFYLMTPLRSVRLYDLLEANSNAWVDPSGLDLDEGWRYCVQTSSCPGGCGCAAYWWQCPAEDAEGNHISCDGSGLQCNC